MSDGLKEVSDILTLFSIHCSVKRIAGFFGNTP